MPDYDAWNPALFTSFTEAVPRDAPVFLSASADTISFIGRSIGAAPDPFADFITAVCTR